MAKKIFCRVYVDHQEEHSIVMFTFRGGEGSIKMRMYAEGGIVSIRINFWIYIKISTPIFVTA